jgi:hypothetical protein
MSDLPTTSKGKIARLTARLREAVNRRLHDGETAGQILPWLNAQPDAIKMVEIHFAGELVTPQNLSAWRQGGFQRWLQDLDETENTKTLAAFAAKLASAAGGDMAAGAKAIAAGKILSRLQSLGDDADMETLLALTKATQSLHSADLDTKKLAQTERALVQKQQALDLLESKFELETSKKFLDWYADERAKRIAESAEPKDVKMDQLRLLLFGKAPEVQP